jgi:glycine/D-amino acid oxidase-like deaminating enzyme
VWDAGLAAIDQIDAIVTKHDIDCGFEWVDGYLHAPHGESDAARADQFRKEASLAQELAFNAAFVEHVPFTGGPGIRFVDQARFHPLKYLTGLAAAVRAKGGAIFEQSGAEEFLEAPLRVKANSRRVRCRDIVIATHNPLVGLAGTLRATMFQTKLALYTSYVIAGPVLRGRVPDALFWDIGTPYHYVRIDPQHDHDLVIFGGGDHKTGQVSDSDACYARLEQSLLAQVGSGH